MTLGEMASVKKIKLSEFPEQAQKLVTRVQQSGESFQIVRGDTVLAELTPPGVARVDTLVGFMRDSIVINGDVISPVITLAKES